jgi:hypothetical protein
MKRSTNAGRAPVAMAMVQTFVETQTAATPSSARRIITESSGHKDIHVFNEDDSLFPSFMVA